MLMYHPQGWDEASADAVLDPAYALDDTLDYPSKISDYPNDIAAAMGLWDAMLERRLTVEMYSRRDGCYAVVVGFPAAYEMYRYSEDIEENKPSRAITRAFILAMEPE